MSLCCRRKRPFSTFACCSQAAHGTRVLCNIKLTFLLELLSKIADHTIIKVFTAKMGVASRCLYLKYTLLNGEKRHIKRSATKVKNKNILLVVLFLIKSIGDCGCGWLVNNTQYVHPRNRASILRGLSLRIIKIRRNSNDRILNIFTNVRFGNLLHFNKNHRGNLLWCKTL